MNKYLIFRTDRIGDFLISAVLIKGIKINDEDAFISIVASKKNYEYVKKFKLVDEVIVLDNGIIDKIKLIYKLRKTSFKNIIIHDNKKRSHLVSFFLKSNNNIKVGKKNYQSHIEIIKDILKALNFSYNSSFLNTIIKTGSKKDIIKNFIQVHFDEKWIFDTYIKKFVKIEPSIDELTSFLDSLLNKTKKRIIITTGLVAPRVLETFIKNNNNQNIVILKNLNFFELENIVLNADILISCHGAISHVAAAGNIKQIDIIDKSYNYKFWTKHFRNYTPINRDSFKSLSFKLLSLI